MKKTSWRFRWGYGWSLLALVLGLPINEAFASMRTPPTYTFIYEGLTDEDIVLSTFLEQVISRKLNPDKRFNYDGFLRLQGYRDIAGSLGKSLHPSAFLALSRCVAEPWPQRMIDDLTGISFIGTDDSVMSMDRALLFRQFNIRATCATALANMGDRRGIPIIEKLVQAMKPFMDKELDQPNPESSLCWAFSKAGRALAILGSKTGIDESIELIHKVPRLSPEVLIYYLQISTKKNFGPYYGQPAHLQEKDIRKWQQFWKTERETFVIDRDFAKNARRPPDRSRK